MKISTGGKAHEPQGMIRCNSEADSIVWMKEDMDKQDLKDRFKRLVRQCIHGSEIVLFQSLFVCDNRMFAERVFYCCKN